MNLTTGAFNFGLPLLTVGNPGSGGLSVSRSYIGAGVRWSFTGTLNAAAGVYTVSIGGSSEAFIPVTGGFVSLTGSGSTLVATVSGYTYTAADGTAATFAVQAGSPGPFQANLGVITSLTTPSGEATAFNYAGVFECLDPPDPPHPECMSPSEVSRLASISNNLGYKIALRYFSDTPTPENQGPAFTVAGADGYNLAASSSRITYADVAVSSGAETISDALGHPSEITFNTQHLVSGYHNPQGSSEGFAVTYAPSTSTVTSWSNGAGTWSYNYTGASSTFTTTVTDPNSHVRTVVLVPTAYDATVFQVSTDADPLGHATGYTYDTSGRVTQITFPEGGTTQFAYDARSNVTTTTRIPKPGSSLANIVTSASYDAACSSPAKCNKPNSTTDSRGGVTDYVYDAASGLLAQVTAPAGASSVRPQTRFAYTSLYASYGGVAAPSPVLRLTGVSTCATAAGSSCVGGSDEVRTAIGYGSGTANNLLPQEVQRFAGITPLSDSTVSYTPLGDVEYATDPLGAVTRYRYDAVRQRTGVVGPDPDGGGPLKNRAIRNTYGGDGQLTLAEQGTVNSQSDPDWAGFATLAKVSTAYDVYGRPIQSTVMNGSSAVTALSQVEYDAASRTICSTVRLNLSSPPSGACTPGTPASFGPDRITHFAYDAGDQLTTTVDGYGSTTPRTLATSTYGNDGEVLTQADAKGNLTTYAYDGFDRRAQIFFPSPTTTGSSSTTDYEQYGFDPAGNVLTDRRRDGSTISYAYDALGNVTSGVNGATYAYDNLSRRISAAVGGQTLGWTYDALSNLLTETSPLGTVTSTYNAGSERATLTWPSGFQVGYAYDATGAMTAVSQSSTTLVSYAYDNLGRRTGMSRADGVGSTFSYGSDLRLSGLSHSFVDPTKNQAWTYGYNPAGQLTASTSSNFAYDWAATNSSRAYTVDGQNKLLTAGGATVTHDGRANITNDGTTAYAYDIANKLISAGSSTLTWDAANRLVQTAGSTTSRFVYDGGQIIAEYDGSGSVLRRYVPGAGQDEPVVWFEGSGAGDARYLIPDRQGSIAAVANSAGSTTAINTYDEYGNGGTLNLGRFQYDGQAWLSEEGLYYARARAYSASLGRFMQTDPIGYGDGLNLYNYVHSDPVNGWDPMGTAADTGSGCSWWNIFCQIGQAFGGGGSAAAPASPPDLVSEVVVTGCGPACQANNQKSLQRFIFAATIVPAAAKQAYVDLTTPKVRREDANNGQNLRCTSGGVQFIAPPYFDFGGIVNAGSQGGGNAIAAVDAVGHFGLFDYQRINAGVMGTAFYRGYTPAANFAVGAYLGGAGFNRSDASAISNTFARVGSSNGVTSEQELYRNAGVDAAHGGQASCIAMH